MTSDRLHLKDKKVLIVGLARSGLAAAAFLRDRGARVTITDRLPASALGPRLERAVAMGCSLALAGHPLDIFTSAELIVVSPGVPLNMAELEAARARGIPVIGELELASRYVRIPVVAISGTNGKTTTTALVGQILQRSGRRVFVGGNIGNPFIEIFQEKKMPEIAVVEVSSFQLDSTETFRPTVAVLLNISEDHLDRYVSFEDYIRSKCRLFLNQRQGDIAILPEDDPFARRHCTGSGRRLYFSRRSPSAAAHLEGNELCCRVPPAAENRYDLSRWRLLGAHNQENLLAAVLAGTCMGAAPGAIQEGIDRFAALPHRLELVHTWRGVRFYNDSKGTTVHSVLRSLESFTAPVILIAGGREKGGSYAPLAAPVRRRVKLLILMGEARFRLARTLGQLTCTVVVDSMESALQVALDAAVPGDVVLLSPACASFDLYENYEARGEHFRSLVHALTAGEPVSYRKNSPWSPARRLYCGSIRQQPYQKLLP